MTATLRRIVQRPRFRRFALATACLVAGALVSVLATPQRSAVTYVFAFEPTVLPSPPPPPPLLVVPVPMIVPFAIPSAPIARARAACPAPHTDAPRIVPQNLGDEILHITASPTDARWIAAWDKDAIMASRDGGKTFARVLDAPGDVVDVAFDCFGHIAALRDGPDQHAQLGVLADGLVNWRSTEGVALVGGGPDLVVYTRGAGDDEHGVVAVSSDLGATWIYHALGAYTDSGRVRGRELADGTIEIDVAFADCMNDELVTSTIRDGQVWSRSEAIGEGAPFARYGSTVIVDRNQWQPALDDFSAIEGLPGDVTDHYVTPLPGPVPIIADGDRLFRIVGGSARPMAIVAHGEPQVVDAAGRVWCLDHGTPVLAGPPLPPDPEPDGE